MPLINIIRAKSKRYERILLKEHIEDVIDRIIQIWIFTQKNKDSIAYDFIKSEEIFKNLTKAAFFHDLGKIDYGFQKKVFEKEERVKENENWNDIVEFFTIDKYPTDFGIPDHEILSIIHTVAFLGNDKWDKRIRTAILLHHYNKFFAEREQHITRMLDDYPNIVDYVKFLISKREQFKEIYEDLIKYLENEFKKKNPPQFIYDALGELKRNLDTNKFTNLLERIDNRFGISKMLSLYELYDKEFNELTEFFVFLGLLRRCDYSASGEIIVEKDVSLESIMQDLPDIIKRNIKIHSEKIWQEEILERHAEKNLILIAPTGSGKTEFALLWARRNSKKLLYTLPLRVALNDLFNRFAGENGYFNKETVDLLHSTSFIEYLKGENGKDISIDEKLKEIKMFASPILLTTPDQVFLSSLKFYGFDKLLSVYPFSSIVIDEIQAYDPEMAAIIIKTLDMIENVNGNVLIITATFPPYYEKFLKRYPKIDLKEEKNHIRQEIKNYNLKRHKIETIEKEIFSKNDNGGWDVKEFNEVAKIINGHSSQNILIIVNNVMKSIKLFEEFNKEPEKWENVYLLHSRLIEKEKSRRIEGIKTKLKSNEKVVVVSTQLVEASVNFDFDVLITEISPIDSQVQRWGRIYRNRNKEYKDKKPNIYVFTGIDKGTMAIYRPIEVLEKTKEVLKKYEKQELGYDEERKMIEEVYNDKKIKEKYETDIEKTLEWLRIYQASKKSEAQRIFRRIAGTQLIIPKIMELQEEKESAHLKNLANIIRNPEKNSSSWKEIAREIFISSNNEEYNVLRILKWMYEYSAPTPEYVIKRHLLGIVKEFKGFYILDLDDEDAEKVRKLGVDIIKEMDLDEYLNGENNIIG